MGIVSSLVSIVVTEALRGQTIAGDDIHDSLISALPYIMEKDMGPVLAVSVENSDSASTGEGFFRTDEEATLMLQIAVARGTSVEVASDDGQGNVTVDVLQIGDNDAAYEATLGLLDRQWRLALSDPENAWAEYFRKLVPVIGAIKSTRLSDPENGRKHAARIVEIAIEPIAEPSPGQHDTDVVEEGLALLETVPEYLPLATIFRDSLNFGADLFDWQKVQARLLTTAEVPGLIGVGTPDDGEAVPTSDVTMNIDGEITE